MLKCRFRLRVRPAALLHQIGAADVFQRSRRADDARGKRAFAHDDRTTASRGRVFTVPATSGHARARF